MHIDCDRRAVYDSCVELLPGGLTPGNETDDSSQVMVGLRDPFPNVALRGKTAWLRIESEVLSGSCGDDPSKP